MPDQDTSPDPAPWIAGTGIYRAGFEDGQTAGYTAGYNAAWEQAYAVVSETLAAGQAITTSPDTARLAEEWHAEQRQHAAELRATERARYRELSETEQTPEAIRARAAYSWRQFERELQATATATHELPTTDTDHAEDGR